MDFFNHLCKFSSSIWNDKQDGKRIRNSEFLIFPKIETKYIETISCYDAPALLRIGPVRVKPDWFELSKELEI